jgi:hypothetical protein
MKNISYRRDAMVEGWDIGLLDQNNTILTEIRSNTGEV